jgi:dTDP-4-dehydrorhamnose reductase/UDP-glucose 4-epimerase
LIAGADADVLGRMASQDLYEEHKLAVEEALRARLGARLTILGVANVFGYERGPGRRMFLSLLLDGLADAGRIRFDMSPFVERDFLPVEGCARVLARMVAGPPRRRAQCRFRRRAAAMCGG